MGVVAKRFYCSPDLKKINGRFPRLNDHAFEFRTQIYANSEKSAEVQGAIHEQFRLFEAEQVLK